MKLRFLITLALFVFCMATVYTQTNTTIRATKAEIRKELRLAGRVVKGISRSGTISGAGSNDSLLTQKAVKDYVTVMIASGRVTLRNAKPSPLTTYISELVIDTVGVDSAWVWNFSIYRLLQTGGSSSTDLAYVTDGATGIISNSNGTGVVIPEATDLIAGLLSATKKLQYDAKNAGVQFKDEGSNLGAQGTVTAVDVTGAGATASRSGNTVTINVPGGGGASSFIWVQQFDDDGSLGSNQVNGIRRDFTLSHTPDTIVYVAKNSKILAGRDYKLVGGTVRFLTAPLKKDTILVAYQTTTAQSPTTRFDSSQISNVVFYGNSLFYGEGSDRGVNDVVSQVRILAPSVPLNFVNRGIGGITAGQMQSTISTNLTPYLKPAFLRNIVVVIEGTNQMIGGATGTTSYQSMKSLCLAIKATPTNPKIIIVTCPPGSPIFSEAQRTIYNDSLRLYYRLFADRLVDLSTKRIGATSAANQIASLYRPDLIHLYPEGYTQMAEAIYPKIMSLASRDSSGTIATPFRNEFARLNGNTADSLNRNIKIGNIRNGGLIFQTHLFDRMRIDSSGRIYMSPAINTVTGVNGVYINPSMTGNSSVGDRVALTVKATISNGLVAGRKVFRLLGENNDTIFDVNSTVNATSGAYQFEFLKNADVRSQTLSVTGNIDLSTSAYRNGIFFRGSGDGTANAMSIGRPALGENLFYNVGNGRHSFRIGNTEKAFVDANGVNGDAFRLNSSVPLNVPTFTTGGVIFANPGTVNATAIGFASNSLIFNGYNAFDFRIQNVTAFFINRDTKRVAIGNNTSPTAWLHLPAGTATAGTGPVKFIAGTNLTTAEAGVVEYDGTEFYATNATTIRTVFSRVLKGSTTLNFGSIAPGATATLTVTVTGATTTDSGVSFNYQNTDITGVFYSAKITSSNTVTITATNLSGSTQDPDSGTCYVTVIK